MFSNKEQNYQKRLFPIRLILPLTFVIIVLSLISKSILGFRYYRYLSEANRVQEVKIIAPRGVFLDRDNQPLVVNKTDAKYGYLRRYLYPEATAHLLGYLSLPDQVNLQDYSCGAPPLSNQFVGKTGLEKYFECLLRGTAGKAIFETNALGKRTRELARSEPKHGQNIRLTVSLKLQLAAQKAMQGLKGAVVATNPKNGEVLLFYSSPSFNNNQIVSVPDLYNQLSLDESKPLFNRLTLGLYPPGSVIKPLIAIGALEDGVITSETQYTDNGIYKLGGQEFGNWCFLQYGQTEGALNIVKAIKRSNDIFFYHLGVEMGYPKINSWFKKLGLANQDVRQYWTQSKTLLPTNEWKKTTFKEPWYLGDTVNLSIGQGFLLVNPLQQHLATSVIINNGIKCNPIFSRESLRHCQDLKLNQEHLNTVIQGMVLACKPGGTGWPLFDYKVGDKSIALGCKTGTAESTSTKALPHAWFIVFAPVHDPEIILTVLVENGGEGSSVAAPIAKQILNRYFSAE